MGVAQIDTVQHAQRCASSNRSAKFSVILALACDRLSYWFEMGT